MHVERENSCMKYGGMFTKKQLAIFPVKDAHCTACNIKGHFTKTCKCKRKIVNIVDSSNALNNDVQSPIQQSEQHSVNNQMEFCGVINAWTEAGLSDNDD